MITLVNCKEQIAPMNFLGSSVTLKITSSEAYYIASVDHMLSAEKIVIKIASSSSVLEGFSYLKRIDVVAIFESSSFEAGLSIINSDEKMATCLLNLETQLSHSEMTSFVKYLT